MVFVIGEPLEVVGVRGHEMPLHRQLEVVEQGRCNNFDDDFNDFEGEHARS